MRALPETRIAVSAFGLLVPFFVFQANSSPRAPQFWPCQERRGLLLTLRQLSYLNAAVRGSQGVPIKRQADSLMPTFGFKVPHPNHVQQFSGPCGYTTQRLPWYLVRMGSKLIGVIWYLLSCQKPLGERSLVSFWFPSIC